MSNTRIPGIDERRKEAFGNLAADQVRRSAIIALRGHGDSRRSGKESHTSNAATLFRRPMTKLGTFH